MILANVIDRRVTAITVTRRPAPTKSAGVVSEGSATTLTIQAFATVLTGEELSRLPEGLTTKEPRQVFSRSAMYARKENVGGDLLTIDGVPWEVIHVDNWQVGGFYRAIVVRV